ncbi:acyl-CoA carboxylase subunit epsilon [Streptomyces sp. NPDC048256]|uniref:acyl-CoA carboxylase subunit epsilon n=1 Tax=Streptomyces sp. NPDC048256 TaxID=3154613 RepID=UPI0033FB590D
MIRVVKGRPTADELAAVVTVLLAREEATSSEPGRPRRATAEWRRLERARVSPSPRSWQSPSVA